MNHKKTPIKFEYTIFWLLLADLDGVLCKEMIKNSFEQKQKSNYIFESKFEKK